MVVDLGSADKTGGEVCVQVLQMGEEQGISSLK